ncbi:MAG: MMPL family transporter [Acidimicrobiia bacterium]|nr:MMPL family transporter [Acidimicrobiia bacterium]
MAAKHPWRVIGVWLLIAVSVVTASATVGKDLEDSFSVPGLDSQIALDLLTDAESAQAGATARIVATPLDAGASFAVDGAEQAALEDVRDVFGELPQLVAISEPVLSEDGRVALFNLQYEVVEDLSPANLDQLKDALDETRAETPLQIEAAGELFFAFEEAETGTGEMIGLIAAVIILLIAFGSVIAMGLPIGMALFGLALGISSMSLISYLIDIPSWAPQMGSMIGLGVGIDYALFLVTRHREFLARGMTIEESVGRATATAGQAVIFAGGTVVIAILGLAVAGIPFMTAAGIATSVIVLIMVVASVTLLPAFLGLAGHWINRLGIHRRHGAGELGAGWQRWGAHVTRHAWPYAIGVTLVLLALTAPVLGLRLGFPDDGAQPESQTVRRAYDLVADGFGPGINGPLIVAMDLDGDVSLVDQLSQAVLDDPGIAATTPPEVSSDAAVATLVAFPTTAPQDDATIETVKRLRAEVFPDVLGGTDVTAHVGGQTANFADVGDRVAERLPAFIAAVIVLSFLLLTLVFRSIMVPLKAALLNLLSIGAAYGVLVMVFQWGWGKGLIGLESTVPIVSFIPMFMFAILFGLSMDYEVFLLSRVREEYLKTGDNDRAVISGIASTARVITSAALIMIAVFGGFVLGDDPTIKMMGLGLATAIFVDATIVRIVLVPATMKLMGDRNWWMPGWLDRILPTVDIEGETGLPAPEFEAAETEDPTEERVLVGVG